jgi:hypothetical protein
MSDSLRGVRQKRERWEERNWDKLLSCSIYRQLLLPYLSKGQ